MIFLTVFIFGLAHAELGPPEETMGLKSRGSRVFGEDVVGRSPSYESKRPGETKPQFVDRAALTEDSNLNSNVRRKGESGYYSAAVFVNQNKRAPELKVHSGEVLEAVVNQDLIGYENSNSPVKAIVRNGDLRGAILVGNLTLDMKTKNILATFTTLRLKDNEEFRIEGVLQDANGGLGIPGEHKSEYWNYFVAETVSRGVGGYADAETQRYRSFYDGYQVTPSLENAGKQGVAAGSKAAAERFAERAKSAPEYSVKRGPLFVRIFITKGTNDI